MAGKSPKRRTSSSATGGPATAAGIDFQVDFAVSKALDAISRFLVNPLEEMEFSMEPRIISDDGDVTLWDLRINPPDTATEAKLSPKRQEVLDWLDNALVGATQSDNRDFELMYGRGAPLIIRAIERLKRISEESAGNSHEFDKRVREEQIKEADVVIAHLGSEPHSMLRRVRVTPTDPAALQETIQLRLRLLLHEPHRHRLYDLLSNRFRAGIKGRISCKLSDMVAEATRAGLNLIAPQTFELDQLDPVVADAVYILQRCECGLPTEVLADAIGVTVAELNIHLAVYVEKKVLSIEGDLWAITVRTPLLVRTTGPQMVERTLRRLLEFYRANRSLECGRRQVPNAIALAKECESVAPELVAQLFWKLDKGLKQIGNKRLVLEVARLSISAAKRHTSESGAKGRAVALICGIAWVYQRMGRLGEARAAGEKSLELGQDIKWHRNTAFCYKCLGRLSRMEAVKNRSNKDKFVASLKASIDYLERAIALFPNVDESNLDRDGELGDCYSLIGRTHFVAGKMQLAYSAAREANKFLTEERAKDFADLQILFGDLAATRNPSDAVSYYERAIEIAGIVDAERSEIAARAYFQWGCATKSVSNLEKAAEIWERLDEVENAATARWHILLFSGRIPDGAQEVLVREKPTVRVEAMRLHEARLSELTAPSRGRRSKPSADYLKKLVETAAETVAIRQTDW